MRKLLVGALTVALTSLIWTATALASPGWGLSGAGGLTLPSGANVDFNVSAHSDVGGANVTGQIHLFYTDFVDSTVDVTCLDVIGTTRAAALGKLERPVTMLGTTFDYGGVSVTDDPGTNSPDKVTVVVSSDGSQGTCNLMAAVIGGLGPLQQGNVVINNTGNTSESASGPFNVPAGVQLYQLGSS